MALSLWDPFGTSRRLVTPFRRGGFYTDPFEQIERSMNLLDRFFDDTMNVQLRDHSAQLKIDDKGDLSYKVDVSGFRPEEINVELQGNEIVVRGEHKEQNDNEAVHRQFVRRVLIPEGIKKDTVKCELADNGRLCICAQSESGGMTRTIPIDFKQSQGQPQQQQQQAQIKQ